MFKPILLSPSEQGVVLTIAGFGMPPKIDLMKFLLSSIIFSGIITMRFSVSSVDKIFFN